MSLLVGSFLDAPSTILRARPHVNLSQSSRWGSCVAADRDPVPHAGKCVSDLVLCRLRGGPGFLRDI